MRSLDVALALILPGGVVCINTPSTAAQGNCSCKQYEDLHELLKLVWQSTDHSLVERSVSERVRFWLYSQERLQTPEVQAAKASLTSENGAKSPVRRIAATGSAGNQSEQSSYRLKYCEDNLVFTDAHGLFCSDWKGYACEPDESGFRCTSSGGCYSAEELELVRLHCPHSCNLCREGAAHVVPIDVQSRLFTMIENIAYLYITCLISVAVITIWGRRSHIHRFLLQCGAGRSRATESNSHNLPELAGEFEAFTERRKLEFRREFLRMPAAVGIFLAVEALVWKRLHVQCQYGPPELYFIRESIAALIYFLTTILLLPQSVLGPVAGQYIALAVNLLAVGKWINFNPYELISFNVMFNFFIIRLVMLVCSKRRHAELAILFQFIAMQAAYTIAHGWNVYTASWEGRCLALHARPFGFRLLHFINLNGDEVSPWRCLFINCIYSISLLALVRVMDALLNATFDREARHEDLKSLQMALMSIMKAFCDCIVYVDENFCLLAPAPKLSALLLRGAPEITQGKDFRTLLMNEEDVDRLCTHIKRRERDLQEGTVSQESAVSHVLQVTLRDADGTPLRVHIYWAESVDVSGRIFFTLGITEIGEHLNLSSDVTNRSSVKAEVLSIEAVTLGREMLSTVPEGVPANCPPASSIDRGMTSHISGVAALLAQSTYPYRVLSWNKTAGSRWIGREIYLDMFDDWFEDPFVGLSFHHTVSESVELAHQSNASISVFFGHVYLRSTKKRDTQGIFLEVVLPGSLGEETMQLRLHKEAPRFSIKSASSSQVGWFSSCSSESSSLSASSSIEP